MSETTTTTTTETKRWGRYSFVHQANTKFNTYWQIFDTTVPLGELFFYHNDLDSYKIQLIDGNSFDYINIIRGIKHHFGR